jgi:hypothetical protein
MISALWVFSSCNKSEDENALSKQDLDFLQKAAQVNYNTIYLFDSVISHIPSSIFSSSGFAATMMIDHKKNQSELNTVAANVNTPLPPNQPDSATIQFGALLKTLPHYTSDTTYFKFQIKWHLQIVDLYQQEANFGNNAQVRHFATKNLAYEVDHQYSSESNLAIVKP